MRVTIIGEGNVDSALQRGLREGGHEVEAVGNEPERVRREAASAEVIILAVPFGAIDDVVGELGGAANGKTVVVELRVPRRNQDGPVQQPCGLGHRRAGIIGIPTETKDQGGI